MDGPTTLGGTAVGELLRGEEADNLALIPSSFEISKENLVTIND